MSNLVKQFHDAKLAYMAGSNKYAESAAALVQEHLTNAAAIGKVLVAVMNADYPVKDCKDNEPLKTALNSCQRAIKRAGECLPDSIGGKLVFKFSTATDNKEKVRTVAVEYLTPSQLEVIDKREKEDAAIEAQRAQEDAALQEERVRQEKLQLTDLDVFLRVYKDVQAEYPDHNIRQILAAGMAWIDKQDSDKQDSGKQDSKAA